MSLYWLSIGTRVPAVSFISIGPEPGSRIPGKGRSPVAGRIVTPSGRQQTASITCGSIVDGALSGNDGVDVSRHRRQQLAVNAYAATTSSWAATRRRHVGRGRVDQVIGGAATTSPSEKWQRHAQRRGRRRHRLRRRRRRVLEADSAPNALRRRRERQLYGGAGKDCLRRQGRGRALFRRDLNKSTNVDRIMDFNAKEDTLSSPRVLRGMQAGKLASKAFYTGRRRTMRTTASSTTRRRRHLSTPRPRRQGADRFALREEGHLDVGPPTSTCSEAAQFPISAPRMGSAFSSPLMPGPASSAEGGPGGAPPGGGPRRPCRSAPPAAAARPPAAIGTSRCPRRAVSPRT